MTIYAVIPIKNLNQAKSRLSRVLSHEKKREIIWRIFRHVVSACIQSKIECVILTSDPDVVRWSSENNLKVIEDFSPLNEALANCIVMLNNQEHELDNLLIVFSDLPMLTTTDLANILKLLNDCDVVICPDLRLEGTNVLAVRKSILFKPMYGIDSFRKHLELFSNIRVKVYVSLGTGFDLDTEEDLKLLKTRNITY